MRKLLLTLILCLITINAYSATEFICNVNGSATEDYNTLTLWEDAMDNAGDITAVDCKVFTVNVETTTFADGEAVTGATSGATGTCIHQTTTQIFIDAISGTFQAEQITGGVAGDITILNDGDSVILVAECYDDDGKLNEDFTLNGFTTSATNKIIIRVPEGERHDGTIPDGTAGDGFILAGVGNNATTFYVRDPNVLVQWVCLDGSMHTDSLGSTFHARSGVVSGNISIEDSICIGGDDADQNTPAINMSETDGHVSNCFAIGNNNRGLGIIAGSYGNIPTLYNNSVSGFSVGITGNATHKPLAKNNISSGNTTDWSGDFNSASTNNMAGDTTTPEYNTYTDSVDADFVSATDLHLQSTSDCIDAGVDLTTTYNANIDIDNRDRDTEGDTWDIGAHEYVAVVPSGPLIGAVMIL